MSKNNTCDSLEKGTAIKTDFLQLTVTSENRIEAETLIRLLTAKRLVACAQVQGPESNAFKNDPVAWRCRFKTSKKLFPQVCSEVDLFFAGRMHALQSLPIVKGSQYFLNWLKTTLDD
jgi:uncharacterized protein involved in tolerance to divalent cations